MAEEGNCKGTDPAVKQGDTAMNQARRELCPSVSIVEEGMCFSGFVGNARGCKFIYIPISTKNFSRLLMEDMSTLSHAHTSHITAEYLVAPGYEQDWQVLLCCHCLLHYYSYSSFYP